MSDFETLEILSEWRFVADTVMGGVSQGSIAEDMVAGRKAVRLQGQVSLDNNDGFIQIATDLRPDGGSVDAAQWAGLALDVWGNGEDYNIHLRTDDVSRPWQSYRVTFTATPAWTTLRWPFSDFAPYRIDAPFDPARLRRIGVVAIGRVFEANVAVAGLRFFR
jgi:adhesin HecA-like repeat protein